MWTFAELFAVCDLHVSRLGLHPATRTIGHLHSADWPRYFDRQGFPIPGERVVERNDIEIMMPTLAWARMREDGDYALVASDDLPDGSRLSTVWLGLDHGFGMRPLIFETMRFAAETVPVELPSGNVVDAHPDLDFPDPFGEPGDTTNQLRYTTEEEALAAHHEIVRRIVLATGH